jgi:hypothetical protein
MGERGGRVERETGREGEGERRRESEGARERERERHLHGGQRSGEVACGSDGLQDRLSRHSVHCTHAC